MDARGGAVMQLIRNWEESGALSIHILLESIIVLSSNDFKPHSLQIRIHGTHEDGLLRFKRRTLINTIAEEADRIDGRFILRYTLKRGR